MRIGITRCEINGGGNGKRILPISFAYILTGLPFTELLKELVPKYKGGMDSTLRSKNIVNNVEVFDTDTSVFANPFASYRDERINGYRAGDAKFVNTGPSRQSMNQSGIQL